MSKKNKLFSVGDLVFAKIKGYPAWPAKITKGDKKRYSVYFYGTGETGNVKSEDVCLFSNNKEKLVTEKSLRRPYFRDAVEQIEDALKGNDPAPLNLTSTDMETESKISDKNNSDIIENVRGEIDIDHNNTDKIVFKQDDKTTSEDVILDNSNCLPPNKELTQEDINIVSRSGRKIKPKRYLISEDDDTLAAPKRKMLNDNCNIMAPKISKADKKKQELDDSLILSEEELQTLNKQNVLLYEQRMLEYDSQIKSCVQLTSADLDQCIKLLNQYKDLRLTGLMLKKNPNCLETIKRLRRYVGNVKNWDLSDEQKEIFNKKASTVRELAEDVYTMFREFFSADLNNKTFYDYFLAEAENFRLKTNHLTTDQYSLITEENQIEEIIKNEGSDLTKQSNVFGSAHNTAASHLSLSENAEFLNINEINPEY